MDDQQDQRQDKPTLIIPAAGRSSRFPNMRPKWMLTHPSGKLMIEMVVEGIDFKCYSKVVFVVLEDHVKLHDADVVLAQAFQSRLPVPMEVCVLQTATKSSCETVYEAICKIGVSGSIVVKDCDCLVRFDLPPNPRFTVGIDIHGRSELKIHNLSQKSFIISSDTRVVDEIVEKSIVSSLVCVGVYGLDSDEMIRSYLRLKDEIGSEMYFSHIVSDLIDRDDLPFGLVYASEYADWGTQEAWFASISSNQTFLIDVDGVMVENMGKYGKRNWANSLLPIQANIDRVKRLSDEGHEIVFITARPDEALGGFRELMLRSGIRYKTILHSCLHGKRTIINDFASSNPYPSCAAINMPRNGTLSDYLT
jgi:hypothetical protein